MDARQATARRAGGNGAIATRIGAVALPLGSIVILVSECSHPFREDPMDNPVVFTGTLRRPRRTELGVGSLKRRSRPEKTLRCPLYRRLGLLVGARVLFSDQLSVVSFPS
jgi:hypothetical protein